VETTVNIVRSATEERMETEFGHLVPHADRVVSFAQAKECRSCESDISAEENYLGEASEPVPHLGWRCEGCGFTIAELLEGRT
jgi:hypothetical protein